MEPQPEPAEEAEPPVDAVQADAAAKTQRPKRKERRAGRKGRRNSVSGESGRGALAEEGVVAEHAKPDEVIEAIRTVIKDCFLFAHLDDAALRRTALAMFKVEKKAGEVVIRQADEGDNFYVVETGVCKCYQGGCDETGLVNVCNKGDAFGELALMYNAPRAATVMADSDVALWALDRTSFSILLMQAALDRRKRNEDFLTYVPVLASLSRYDKLMIADAIETVSFEGGQVIFKQGDASEWFFIVQEGEVVVSQVADASATPADAPEPEPEPDAQAAGGAVELVTLHRGEYFGELGLLLNTPRLATCTALGDTMLAKVHKSIFEKVLPALEGLFRKNAKLVYTNGAPLPPGL